MAQTARSAAKTPIKDQLSRISSPEVLYRHASRKIGEARLEINCRAKNPR